MIKKRNKGASLQRIAALVIGIGVLAYSVYHISSLFGEDIATVATGISTESRVIDGKGYVFRDETPLYSSYSGVADYYCADGAKVSKGDALAEVRRQGTATAKALVKLLDKQIGILEQSVESGITLAQLPEVNDNISDAYYSLAKMLAAGDTGGISEQADKLLLNMNVHSLLTDENSRVDDTLEGLRAQREAVLQGGGDGVVEYAEDSGYFYSYVDGYEQYFTTEAADVITAESYYSLISEKTQADSVALTGAYGRLSENSEWRFVVRMSSATMGYFKLGETYRLQFVENGDAVIPMTLTYETEDSVYGGKIFVFFANRLPSGFVFSRSQSVSIEVSTASGIYVPKSAVHRMGGSYCVYVLRGSVVRLRRIDIVYEGTDYYLAATGIVGEGGAEYLDTNELLITRGSNLFDGRILD